MEKFDTGDLIFAKFNCDYSISADTFIECFKKKLPITASLGYEAVGIIIRHGEDLSVITDVDNEIRNLSYPQFLSLPIFEEVTAKKLVIDTDDREFLRLFSKRALLLYYQLEAFRNSKKNGGKVSKKEDKQFWDAGEQAVMGEIEEQRARIFLEKFPEFSVGQVSSMIDYLKINGVVKDNYKFDGFEKFEKYSNGYEMFFDQMNMLREGVETIEIEDLATKYPPVWKDIYSLDNKIIVRGVNNMDLLRDESFGR